MRAALVACLLAVAASLGGLNLLAAELGRAPAPVAQEAERAADPDTVAFERARERRQQAART